MKSYIGLYLTLPFTHLLVLVWATVFKTRTTDQELTALLHIRAADASFSLTRWQHSTLLREMVMKRRRLRHF